MRGVGFGNREGAERVELVLVASNEHALVGARRDGQSFVPDVSTGWLFPLAQAERRLRGTVARLLSAPSDGGGLGGRLRRRLEATLMARIETLTLARLRDEDARADSVDLLKVRDELSAHVDDLIADHVRSALTRMTVLVASGACLGAAMIGWIIRSL